MMNIANNAAPKKIAVKNIILVVLVILISVIPIFMLKHAEFGGADGEAEAAITEINPEYTPWFKSFWEPPSGEIESLLFALQASLGTLVIGYYIGYVRGRKKREDAENS